MTEEMKPEETKPAVKPGYRTTEGWLAAAALLLSMLYALGVVGNGQTATDKMAALVGAALISAGYSVSRGTVKSKA